MPTKNKSYDHKSIKDKEMKVPAYERARESDLKTREDFNLTHETLSNWYKDRKREGD